MTRRDFLASSTSLAAAGVVVAQPRPAPTRFQIACMTLPYSRFPLARALEGIKSAGYSFIAWGTTHRENGKDVPVLAADTAPDKARDLAARCRDRGLEPV